MQSLNLKNPRAYVLAAELARLTGQSMTSAVIDALEERLGVERQKGGGRATADRILDFADRFSAGMAPGSRSCDHAGALYDDSGMPS